MRLRYAEELPVESRRVFLRVDLNVPLDRDLRITDDTRIQESLPTIRHLTERKARVVLASHLGRPKGKPEKKYSLEPVAAYLAEALESDVLFTDDCIGDGVKKVVSEMEEGQVVLLENLRFHDGEEKNDPSFAEELASLYEVYVNDAFGTMHRAHASTEGMVKHFKEAGAGFLVRKEVEALAKLLESPSRPFVLVVGGAKVSDKMGVLENLVGKVDSLLLGGGMAFTFLAAMGVEVGNSLVENEYFWRAKKIMERAAEREVRLLLPVDHVAAERMEGGVGIPLGSQAIPPGLMGLDIGRKTQALFREEISKARTVFWNGTMGVFEVEGFEEGTRGVAEAVAEKGKAAVVGGGDTVAALKKCGLDKKVGHVSTGGGASLEFLEGKELPGLKVLRV